MSTHVELSHPIESGMRTYPDLPSPVVSEHLTRAMSRVHYASGTEFSIGRINMIGNTGTYLDAPFHRFSNGVDLAMLELSSFADLPGLLVHAPAKGKRAIDARSQRQALAGRDPRGCAVLLHTGWAQRWGTAAYLDASHHPYLTREAAEQLVAGGAALVGIDSLNIDDTTNDERPAHTILLGAGIPIVEHLCHLDDLPEQGFYFSAAPTPVRGMGSFPVRAYARLLGNENHEQ